MKRVLVTIVFALSIAVVCGQAQATVLYAPITFAASSTESDGAPASTYGINELFDGTVTDADIGTINNQSSGAGSGVWASYGWRPGLAGETYGSPAVTMDFGSSITFDSLMYAQRPNGTDNIASVGLWFSDSPYTLLSGSPGTPTGPENTPNPAGAADESLIITEENRILRQYDFASDHTARYVFARLYVPAGWTIGASNPGGAELRLGAVPEPSAMVLLTGGLLSLLAYAWRKRK